MKKLFFVRHGETDHNVNKMWAGQIESSLTAKGIDQAKQVSKAKLPHIDIIISSPFARAYNTAKIIADGIGYPVRDIKKNDLFIERSWGVLEGTPESNYDNTLPQKNLDKVEGVEHTADLQVRAAKALEYVESLPEDNVLVVSHGTFGRAFRRAIEKLPHTLEYQVDHRELFRIGNAEIVELI